MVLELCLILSPRPLPEVFCTFRSGRSLFDCHSISLMVDYIIINRKHFLTDVSVVPKFYTGSDDRFLRARFCFSRQGEKTVKSRELEEHHQTSVSETLELTAWSCNYKPTFEIAKLCRASIKVNHKERRSEVLAKSAEARLSISNAQDFGEDSARSNTITKLIEVSREYKLTYIDLKKALDSAETEAVVVALLTHSWCPYQYVRVLRKLHSCFTTKISPFYISVIVNGKEGAQQVNSKSSPAEAPTSIVNVEMLDYT
ncbi:unnamed protein product [Heligmosomoides polygyrus]|uniref:Thioredoxin domain-containing protein n=1 Tax=Heligmosomoides polygyrus TaxID=6339 RepID=A0A183FS81_HELPZ|nr:unnamed protein product [Heligmosomoides polygyrus]